MARIKIDYGIDLGTTNSAIARIENGNAKIQKIEVTDDTMPSCIYFNKKKNIIVGKQAYSSMKSDKKRATKKWSLDGSNTFVEFKRKMGELYEYYSSNMEQSFSPEDLSAEVLKSLKSYIQDESFKSIVITVPAKFHSAKKDATVRSARLAGFEQCELLQEPIAASLAYGLSTEENDGIWMVFDFGGGTFDAALLRVEEGIMQIFGTAGDDYLGGKNLDEAIVDKLIIPYIRENFSIEDILANNEKRKVLREAMKTYAEEIKNQLSFKQEFSILTDLGELGEDDEGNEIELDITISQPQLEKLLTPIFQSAIDIANSLLAEKNLSGSHLNTLILVGGPTHSPILRKMIKDQITDKIDTSVDPMTAVACGAALYASSIDNKHTGPVSVGTVSLDLSYNTTSVEEYELVTVKINTSLSKVDIPEQLYIEIVRDDLGWSSGKVSINEVGEVIECLLQNGRSNKFNILAYDGLGNTIKCFPNEISIIQGKIIGKPVLPYHWGIEIWNETKGYGVIDLIKGLEKDRPIPATGIKNGLKTTNDIRTGISEDVIKIPIYEAEADSVGGRATYENISYEVVITGDDVPVFIPNDSDVDMTIKYISDSERKLVVDFPDFNFPPIEKELNAEAKKAPDQEYLLAEIEKAKTGLRKLTPYIEDVSILESEIEKVSQELQSDSEAMQVLQHLRIILRKIDKVEEEGEWSRVEKELRGAFYMLEEDNLKYGNKKSLAVAQIKEQVDDCILRQDIKIGKELLDKMNSLNFEIARIEYYIAWISDWNKRFNSIKWKDPKRARELVNKGVAIINDVPDIVKIEPIVAQLIHLSPSNKIPPKAKGLLTSRDI